MRPMAPPRPAAAYHRLPSGPAAIPVGLSWVKPFHSDMTPVVVTRPIWFLAVSVNQMPSGPVAIPVGWASFVGTAYAPTVPAGVIQPIWPGLALSANQTLPSGPSVTPAGPLPAANSVMVGDAWAGAVAHSAAARRPRTVGMATRMRMTPISAALPPSRGRLDTWPSGRAAAAARRPARVRAPTAGGGACVRTRAARPRALPGAAAYAVFASTQEPSRGEARPAGSDRRPVCRRHDD